MNEIDVLELRGTPWEMGLRHGQLHRAAIRRFAEERVSLAGGPEWTGRSVPRSRVLEIAEACLAEHERFSPAGAEELRGLAEGSGLSAAELLIVNGFTDFVDTVHAVADDSSNPSTSPAAADDCTAVLVPSERAACGQAMLGQTWDMHPTGAEHVLLLHGRPADAPAFVAFTSVGCVGMIGMNEAGLAVGINNLLGGDGRIGVTWPFVVREMLRCQTLEQALAVLERAPLAGAHNYLLMDGSGRGANVEASASRRSVSHLADQPLVHTNHCLAPAMQEVERPRGAHSQAASVRRLERAEGLLADGEVSPERLQDLFRDPEAICVRPTPELEIASCGAVVMRPASGELWAVKGFPSEGLYQRFDLMA